MSLTSEQMYGLITKPQPELIERYDMINKPDPDELYHFGILGMKWGIRRYQNKDGTLTEAGKKRYSKYFDENGNLNDAGMSMVSAYANKRKRNKDTKIMYDYYQGKQKDAYYKNVDKKNETGRPIEIVPHDKIDELMKKHNVSYEQIYSEMSKEDKRFKDLMNSEEPDDYRDAEAAWYLKHKDDKM